MIDPATNTVIGSPIPVDSTPTGVAANPTGGYVYVANNVQQHGVGDRPPTNTVTPTIPVGNPTPGGVAVNPTGGDVYVTNTPAAKATRCRC